MAISRVPKKKKKSIVTAFNDWWTNEYRQEKSVDPNKSTKIDTYVYKDTLQ